MKWIEQHWILTVVIVVVVLYLYSSYGATLILSGNTSQQS